jgi:uncharacterized membrane protein YebE (DUF533 family)
MDRNVQGRTDMFNPEKLLGGLIRSTTRGSSAGSLLKGGAALGLLGVAIEAAEHYLGNQQQTTPPGSRPRSAPPVPPPPATALPASSPGTSPGPPPPPGARPQAAPPDPPDPETAANKAVLLIRAMIAAANADGVIDQAERDRILKKLQSVDLSPEEQAFMVKELLSPSSLEDITRQVDHRQLAMQVYAVSLMAIRVDTDAEHHYMRTLAQQLDLDEKTIRAITEKVGSPHSPGPSSTKGE